MRRVALFLPLLAIGCARQDALMPLEVGRDVTYVVRTGFSSSVEPVRITRLLPVAGVRGAELTGPLGTARMAWKEGVLYADSTAHGRFSPPLPLLAEDAKDRTWHGRLEILGREQPASAKLTHKKETLRLGSRKVATTLANLVMELPASKGKIELDSWYQPGVGLVQQEQRTNGRRVIRLELLSGP
ncbi:MAG: hypothetical protein ACO1SV_20480 [Fimbriimonas sp.]